MTISSPITRKESCQSLKPARKADIFPTILLVNPRRKKDGPVPKGCPALHLSFSPFGANHSPRLIAAKWSTALRYRLDDSVRISCADSWEYVLPPIFMGPLTRGPLSQHSLALGLSRTVPQNSLWARSRQGQRLSLSEADVKSTPASFTPCPSFSITHLTPEYWCSVQSVGNFNNHLLHSSFKGVRKCCVTLLGFAIHRAFSEASWIQDKCPTVSPLSIPIMEMAGVCWRKSGSDLRKWRVSLGQVFHDSQYAWATWSAVGLNRYNFRDPTGMLTPVKHENVGLVYFRKGTLFGLNGFW